MDLEPTMFFSNGVLPFSTEMLPLSQELVFPPLPQSSSWQEDACVGSDEWKKASPAMKGKAGFFWSKGGLTSGEYSDKEGFPDIQPWSLGIWVREMSFSFILGESLDKKSQ